MTNQDELFVYTIYHSPSDFPDQFVMRKHVIRPGATTPTDDVVTADTLENIRKSIPDGLIRLERDECDDPVIVEVWI